MTSSLLPLFLAVFPQAAAPRPLATRISEVTVYGGTASVRRSATVPAGDGLYVVGGLPMTLDPESLRVRLAGGEVVGVETRRRVLAAASDERLAELRARIRALEDELHVLKDEDEVQGLLADHVTRLLKQEERTHQDEVGAGRVNPEAWEANYRFLAQKMKELKDARRELARRKAEKELALADLRGEQGRGAPGAGVPQLDVVLDLVGGGGTLELEYLVSNAGWEPYYDLRAKKDLATVELAYRARIFQNTGEDWSEAEVLLSTAQPQRGAQGPEPVPQWLSLNDPRRPSGRRGAE
ncbi:MAG: mucoidy inhibitor MuiA family protein, partial [Planctomycetota bacterium]